MLPRQQPPTAPWARLTPLAPWLKRPQRLRTSSPPLSLSLSVTTAVGVSQPTNPPLLGSQVETDIGVAASAQLSELLLSVSTSLSVGGRARCNPGELLSGRRRGGIFSFERTSDGTLFMADGAGAMMKWDGFSPQLSAVGVIAPSTATNMTGSGQGAIVGTYYAYVRFVDKDNNYSALSPISPQFVPVGPTSQVGGGSGHTITNIASWPGGYAAGVLFQAGTMRVTSQGHGLRIGYQLNGATITPISISGVVGTTEANGQWSVYADTPDTFLLSSRAGGSGSGLFTNTYVSGGTWTVVSASASGATNAAPIVITSTGHGLTSGTVVTISGVEGNDAANGTWTITVIDADTFSLDTSAGDGDYIGGGTWVAGISTITYNDVPVPTEAKVTRRQILRNTDGQASTFYVDVDTTDLTSTTLTSTNVDSVLQANTAVPLFDSDGNIFANQYGVPPDWKACIANHQGRMYATGEITVNEGHAAVTFGSKTVTGVGTNWLSNWAGRFFSVTGADQAYEIASVSGQTITLTSAYLGPTDLFAQYAIKPAPAERKLVYYSAASLPEAWNATFAFSVPEDNDDITGMVALGSYLYILEGRHIYRWTSQADPAQDGFLYLAALRGCINNRCYVVVEDTAYMLDSQGIHAFQGGPSNPISQPIQDLFRPSATSLLRINWAASKYFHAGHFPAQECIRWFVALDGSAYPQHAIGYSYRHNRWWVEEFPWPVTSSATWPVDIPGLLLGIEGTRVVAYWQGTLDGPDPGQGTVRGTVTSSTLTSISDSTASFASSGLANAPVAIVAGTGKGQVRRVVSVSGTTINVSEPWLKLPDTTSQYQLGAVEWTYRTGWFRWIITGDNVERRLEVTFLPLDNSATMDLRYYHDFDSAEASVYDITSNDNDGVALTKGSSDAVVDLTKDNGLIQLRLPAAKDLYLKGHRFVSIGLHGFTNADAVQVYQIGVDGAK